MLWDRFQWRLSVFKLGGSSGDREAVHLDDLKQKWDAYRMVAVEADEDEGEDGKEEEEVPLNPKAVFQATLDQADLLLERVDEAERNFKEEEEDEEDEDNEEEEKRKMEQFARLWSELVSEAGPFDGSLFRQRKARLLRQADLWLLKKQVDYFCQSELPVCLPAALSSNSSTSTTSSSFSFPFSNSPSFTPTFLLESLAAQSGLLPSISSVLLLQLASIGLLATFWDSVLSRPYLPGGGGGSKEWGSFFFLGFQKANYLFEYYFSAPNERISPDPAEKVVVVVVGVFWHLFRLR